MARSGAATSRAATSCNELQRAGASTCGPHRRRPPRSNACPPPLCGSAPPARALPATAAGRRSSREPFAAPAPPSTTAACAVGQLRSVLRRARSSAARPVCPPFVPASTLTAPGRVPLRKSAELVWSRPRPCRSACRSRSTRTRGGSPRPGQTQRCETMHRTSTRKSLLVCVCRCRVCPSSPTSTWSELTLLYDQTSVFFNTTPPGPCFSTRSLRLSRIVRSGLSIIALV